MASSKLIPYLLKQSLKTQKKLRELEILYQNPIYICISWYSKVSSFLVKKLWCKRNSRGVSRDSYIISDLCLFWLVMINSCIVLVVRLHKFITPGSTPDLLTSAQNLKINLNFPESRGLGLITWITRDNRN